jgi:hypothetical protein
LIMERIDGAQLAQSRDWLDHPKVLGVIKGYRLRPPELNNRFKGRYLAYLLRDGGITPTKESMCYRGRPKQISARVLSRIRLMYGFGAYGHLDGPAKALVDFSAPRPYDVHYAATLSYSGSEVEVHRRTALKEVQRYEPQSRAVWASGNTMPGALFRERMLESKAVVSPWGCGEPCHRDYEAMLLGAVVIKPNSDHVECWPQVFEAGQTYIPCRPDFADLHDRIHWVVNHWRDLKGMRIRNRELVMESRQRDVLADYMANLFHGVMDGKDEV